MDYDDVDAGAEYSDYIGDEGEMDWEERLPVVRYLRKGRSASAPAKLIKPSSSGGSSRASRVEKPVSGGFMKGPEIPKRLPSKGPEMPKRLPLETLSPKGQEVPKRLSWVVT